MIFVLDTSKPEAFLGLWDGEWKAEYSWNAGRSLSAEILEKMKALYQKAGIRFNDTEKIIVAAGPGSFTGLRIGLSLANALAYSLDIPIASVESSDNNDDILHRGLAKIESSAAFEKPALPEYGAEPNISQPKKPF